jgi:poly(3-hydroxyalkanoate) synthetase
MGRTGSNGSRHMPARQPGNGKYAPLEDAPGSYVRVRD